MARSYNRRAIRRHLKKGDVSSMVMGVGDKKLPKRCKWYVYAQNRFFSSGYKKKSYDVACAKGVKQMNCMLDRFKKSGDHKFANSSFGIPTALKKKNIDIKVWNPRSNYLLGGCKHG
tara:strand:- start:603 stop:953 length:351 start_codon:yes stop_codon:yes gene_type:complete